MVTNQQGWLARGRGGGWGLRGGMCWLHRDVFGEDGGTRNRVLQCDAVWTTFYAVRLGIVTAIPPRQPARLRLVLAGGLEFACGL